LYKITESGDEEKALIAAVTRKHQIEADRVIGGIGRAAAVTMLRDALLSTALYVCQACVARVLGARYQRREDRENVNRTKLSDADTTAAILIPVALARVITGIVPERKSIVTGSMLVASHGQMATDSAPPDEANARHNNPPDFYVLWNYMWLQSHPSGMSRANARQ